MTPVLRLAIPVLAASTVACAHAADRAAGREQPTWPAPPASPRARLSFVIPEPGGGGSRPPWWRRALDGIAGIERRDAGGPFVRPFGVAASSPDEIYVADPDAAVVAVVRGRGAPRPVSCAGREWEAPIALALDETGRLWVADAGAGEVVRRDPDGRCSAIGGGRLTRPTGVAAKGGRIFVADPPSHVVLVMSEDGAELARLGGHGTEDGQLAFPSAVAVAADGTLLVVDALNFRIARFATDGRWLGSFGSEGDEQGGFVRPKGIATTRDGRIYVSDAQRDVVLVFSPDHAFEYAIGSSGVSPGAFSHPAGLAVAADVLLVADSYGGRIEAFELLGGRS